MPWWYVRHSKIFSRPRCRYPMTGMHSTTFSPESFRTRRSTPWVEGCCGPMLRMSSSVSSPSSSMTGSSICVSSRVGRVSASVLRSGASDDLFAKSQDSFGERLGTRRAPWHVHIDRDHGVDALQRRIAVPELAAARGAVPHRDDPLGLGHLLVQATEARGHLVGHRPRDDHHVRLTGARAEDLRAEAREVVVLAGSRHHLDGAARESVTERPGTARPSPVH